MAVTVVVCKDALIYQVCLILATTTIAVAIIGLTSPYKTAIERRAEFFNEAIIVCVLCTLMCLSDFVLDLDTRVFIGNVAAGLVCLHLVASIAWMTFNTLINLKRTCRMKAFKKRQQKQR